jgi:hypothetical protein
VGKTKTERKTASLTFSRKSFVRAFERLSDAVEPLPSSANQFYPDKEQNDCADDRHNETRRMKRRTRFRFRKQPSDKSADDGATDANQRRHYETEMLCAGHNRACDQPDNETDNDVPNEV